MLYVEQKELLASTTHLLLCVNEFVAKTEWEMDLDRSYIDQTISQRALQNLQQKTIDINRN